MTRYHVALVPTGKLSTAELEAAAARVAKVVKQTVEIRSPLQVPHTAEDPGRGQYRAAVLLTTLRRDSARLKPGQVFGALADAPAVLRPDGYIFVTDVDLYTAKTEGVLAAVNPAEQSAVVSVRRLREAFYRRKADPQKQQSRVVKEILRMWGRLRGVGECVNPTCALAPSRGVPDIDSKSEGYCRDCSQRLFAGTVPI